LPPKCTGGRRTFDPQSDSTIRVQAGRLRLKLADYYAGEGAADPSWSKFRRAAITSYLRRGRSKRSSPPTGTQLRNACARNARKPRGRSGPGALANRCGFAAGWAHRLAGGFGKRSLEPQTIGICTTAKPSVAAATGPLADFWRPFTQAWKSLGSSSAMRLLWDGLRPACVTTIRAGTRRARSTTITRVWARCWPSMRSMTRSARWDGSPGEARKFVHARRREE
jgi:hypothetical protein